jgi:hypothetical protein
MQADQIKTQSLSPVTDAEAVPESIICERNYEPDGYVPANVARQMEIQLRALLNLLDVHIDELDCEGLQRQAKVANAMLNEL